jgi:choline-sulfatase
MRRSWLLVGTIALFLFVAVGLWSRSRPKPLNIVFLTVESWRAETATPERMPNLFQAAAEGSRYVNHRAISAWTGPNIIAVLTGLSPFEQGVHARGQSIDAKHDVFLEDLAHRGWEVVGLQSFMAIDVFRNLGLTVTPERDPFAWLTTRPREGKPFVLWHHYLNTHLPYAPPKKFRGPYDAIATDRDPMSFKLPRPSRPARSPSKKVIFLRCVNSISAGSPSSTLGLAPFGTSSIDRDFATRPSL